MAESRIELKSSLTKLLTLYRHNDYKSSIKTSTDLLKTMLFWGLKEKFLEKVQAKEGAAFTQYVVDQFDKKLEELTLLELVKVYEEHGCLEQMVNDSSKHYLIQSFNLGELYNLINHYGENPHELESNHDLARLSIQQVIQFLIVFSYTQQINDLKDEEDFIDGLKEEKSKLILEEFQNLGFKEKFFYQNLERGLLLNAADRNRNIAFKIETFVNLLVNIFKEIKKQLLSEAENEEVGNKKKDQPVLRKRNEEDAIRIATDVIEQAGRDSGQRFGTALFKQLQQEGERLSIKEKIDRWCEFDSEVGFGKFSAEGINVEGKIVKGEITLQENFLVSGRKIDDDNLSCFMKGYIHGVLLELTGAPIKISHKRKDSAQFIGGDKCTFHILVDEKAEKEMKAKINALDLNVEL